MRRRATRRWQLAMGCAAMLTTAGCAFGGLNSIPLPGTVGRGPGAQTYHVEIANVATLESNSPVMISDVIVGSVGKMRVKDRHADVEVWVKPGVAVPANAVASVGQTSLLGSMHLQLNPPVGQAPRGHLEPGATIALNKSSTYPSTEQTLSALSLVVNGGGFGQIGDIIHNFNAALSGNQHEIRDLLTRFDTFLGTLDRQRDNIIASIDALDRLTGTFADQRDVVQRALQKIPPALDVLIRERPRLTTALDKLRIFSDTATKVIDNTQADLVRNLTNLEPAIRVLADIGPELDFTLSSVLTFPYNQEFIDRAIRGDYLNLFGVFDLTIPRLKKTLFLGTRFGQQGAPLVPAPGDPYYLNPTYDPAPAGPPPAPMAALSPADAALAPLDQPDQGRPAATPPTPGGR